MIPLLPEDLAEATAGSYIAEDLKSKLGESVVVYPGGDGGPGRLLLLGAGKAPSSMPSRFDGGPDTRYGPRVHRSRGVGVYLAGMEKVGVQIAGQAAAEGAAWRPGASRK